MASNEDKTCMNSALRLLTRRDHGCAELDSKLKVRGYGQREIAAAIDACLRLGYLNDERYADVSVQQLQRNGCGIHLIRQKLNARKLPSDTIRLSIAAHCTEDAQLDACRQALAKKMKALHRGVIKPELRIKLQRFLFGRGFARHIIHRIIEETLDRQTL